MADMKWFEDLQAKKAEISKQIGKEGMVKLEEVFKSFLTENTQYKGVCWTQYTPYFNDGDTCEFSVHSPSFVIEEIPHGADDLDDDDYYGGGEKTVCEYTDGHKQTVKKFTKGVFDGNDDVFELVFGDHVRVLYTLDHGFEVDEYEHD